jgi:hypothetical protein
VINMFTSVGGLLSPLPDPGPEESTKTVFLFSSFGTGFLVNIRFS